jgi:hypothetical protein
LANYLLFDSSCARCGNLARTVEKIGGGWLESRSLEDPHIQEMLSQARPGWDWKPMLVTVRRERVRVYSGIWMVLRLGVGLGPRKSFRILTSAA